MNSIACNWSSYNVKPARHPHTHILPSLAMTRSPHQARKLTAVIGIEGAWGKMNFTSSSLSLCRQFSTAEAQPWPVSPRPWKKMTVAVCLEAAGKINGAVRVRDILSSGLEMNAAERVSTMRVRRMTFHGWSKIHIGEDEWRCWWRQRGCETVGVSRYCYPRPLCDYPCWSFTWN